MFNTLKYTQQLEEAGFTRKQAETNIQIMSELIETSLATKQDMKDLEVALRNDFEKIRSEMALALAKQTNKLGTIVSIALAAAVALNKIL